MPFNKHLLIFLFLSFSLTAKSDYFVSIRGFQTAKHPEKFTHTSYANPNAPKKGSIKLPAKKSTFSSFNPYIPEGVEATGLDYLNATLMKVPLDDQMVAYPYVAKGVFVGKDHKSVTFILNDQAKFSDGSPVTADDVAFSYDSLKEKGKPNYRLAYHNVESVDVLGPHKIRFTFKKADPSMPFTMAKMPVLSKKFYEKNTFSKASLVPAVGAGPYKLKNFKNGKYIIYERIKDWWAKDLPIVKGLYNFDTIKYVYYYNYDAIVDGLKRGEIDHNIELKVSRWENKYDTAICDKEKIIKKEFIKPVPHGLNGFFINARRGHLSDARVRKALNLLFNFNWINKTLFNNKYKRNQGIFNSTEFNAKGPLSDAEKSAMKQIGVENISLYEHLEGTKENTVIGLDRENMDHAIRLLMEAGWRMQDGFLKHDQYGEFTFEILLPAAGMARYLENYMQTLRRMGIKASIKTVDPAQFELRLRNFDFDLILFFMPVTYIPGKSLENIWGSQYADIKGSYNLSGVKSKVVDQVIDKLSAAQDMNEVKLYASILDRLIRQEYYFIPAWYRDEIYVAYRDKFGYIDRNENGYSINAWWSKE